MNLAAPRLFAPPETVAEVSRAPAVAILVGSYDGSGNYGDIAQLDAALTLLARLEPGILLLPVLERAYLDSHEALAGEFLSPPKRPLFFDPGEGLEDALQPVGAPADPASASIYLYGGGYLNPSWGTRKLAMLAAAEELLAGSGVERVCRVSSGLQVDPEWVAGLETGDAEALGAFELLGVRDRDSGEALAALGSPAPILDTADDVVGIVRRLPLAVEQPDDDGKLRVNLHLNEHEWVTNRPGATLPFYAELVSELQRLTGLPVISQPVIAYLDGRIDEREALGPLAEAWASHGLELTEPRVLRPASLATTLTELRRAALTLSCSYHVALTSLLLGVPAVLLRDNPYYEQKATGLADAFGLPPEFALTSASDPVASAAELIAALSDPQRAAELRGRLWAGASAVRERRAAAEVELLERLTGAATTALSERVEASAERLRERSAEPAELQARLARLEPEDGGGAETETTAPPPDPRTEETLAAVLNSSSWRVTAPLRRAGALFRRRG